MKYKKTIVHGKQKIKQDFLKNWDRELTNVKPNKWDESKK